MKIVHLTDTYAPVVGGIERQIERLATLQVAAGHDVTVVTGRSALGPAHRLEDGVVVRRPVRPTRRLHALPLHVDDMDADVFHAHLSVMSPGTVQACTLLRSVGLPLAVTVHSMWPTAPMPARTVVRLAALDTSAVAWSAVSRAAAARVQAALTAGSRVDVVPNAVDTAWWTNPSPLGVGPGISAVIVGRLAPRKRVLPFLRALAGDWPDTLDVTVVGEGPQSRAISRLARRSGLDDRLRMFGARSPSGIRRILHQADVFVAPSALESFGIAALEARAAGLPVLARRGTGVADFVEDGVDGWFADSDDTLAAGLRSLAATPTRVHTWKAIARRCPPPINQTVAAAAVDGLYDRATFQRRSAFPTPPSGAVARTSSGRHAPLSNFVP